MATPSATRDFRDTHEASFGESYFRTLEDRHISSIGLGTYLGEPTDEVDREYEQTILTAIKAGCNVLDTAINYRHQRSERVIGKIFEQTPLDRDEIFVSTKGGFVPFDGRRPADPGTYVKETYVDTGVADPEEFVAGSHCIAPDYIEDQLERSLSNLGTEIDCYYVHNPETQLQARPRDAVYDRLEETFVRLENRVAAGDIGTYGVATWDAFRVPANHGSFLSLPDVLECARDAADRAGNDRTGFRAIQLPFNVVMADAFTVDPYETPDGTRSVLEFAADAGLSVFTSASIAQGDLAAGVPEDVAERVPGETPVQKAINFARSAPGVTTSLVGMSSVAHVEENIAAGEKEPLEAETFATVFGPS